MAGDAGAAGAGVAEASAGEPVSKVYMTSPTCTSCCSSTWQHVTVPVTGEGISTAALSVSTSISARILLDGLALTHVQLDHRPSWTPTEIGKELDGHDGAHSQATVSCTAAITSSASGRKCFSTWK